MKKSAREKGGVIGVKRVSGGSRSSSWGQGEKKWETRSFKRQIRRIGRVSSVGKRGGGAMFVHLWEGEIQDSAYQVWGGGNRKRKLGWQWFQSL